MHQLGITNTPGTQITTEGTRAAEKINDIPPEKLSPEETNALKTGILARKRSETLDLLVQSISGSEKEPMLAADFRRNNDLSRYKQQFSQMGLLAKISLVMRMLNVSVRVVNVEAAPPPPESAPKEKTAETMTELMHYDYLETESWKRAGGRGDYCGWSVSFKSMGKEGEIWALPPKVVALPAPTGVNGSLSNAPTAFSSAPNLSKQDDGYSSFIQYVHGLVAEHSADSLFKLRYMHSSDDTQYYDRHGAGKLQSLIEGQRIRFVVNPPKTICGTAEDVLLQLKAARTSYYETFDGLVEFLKIKHTAQPSAWVMWLEKLVGEMQQIFGTSSIIPMAKEIINNLAIEHDPKTADPLSRMQRHDEDMERFSRLYDKALKQASQLGL